MLSTDAVCVQTLHLDQGVWAFHKNEFETALVEFDMALAMGDTPYGRFDRSLTLLALGRYPEGFADYRVCWQIYRNELTERGKELYFYNRHPVWEGEPNVPVTILHEAGFGDGIQMLRYVPMVQKIASSVQLEMPSPLKRLGSQLAPIVETDDVDGYVVPWFNLMTILRQTTATIPPPPYLRPDAALTAQWANRIGNGGRRRIGICWSTKFEGETEPLPARRPIPLDQFLDLLPFKDCQLYSLQTQECEEATLRGIWADTFEDFADVAAIMSLMDAVVSIDSAALHLAGAIGHPCVYGMLPYAATWRWRGNHWYPNMDICQQDTPGDWESAFRKVRWETL